MENELIKLYTEGGLSIEGLCSKFKIGKLKVKKILNNNDIPLNKKGGQKRIILKGVCMDQYNGKSLKCLKTGKVIDDVHNKSGSVTTHIKNTYDIELQSRYIRGRDGKISGNYWYHNYFELVNYVEPETWECPTCDFTTKDTKNLGGFITRHVLGEHKLSLREFFDTYPKSRIELREDKINLEDPETFIRCKICDEPFRSISNTHLKLHNTTPEEYYVKYGNLTSEDFREECKGYLDQGRLNITNNFTSKAQTEINEYINGLGIETSVNNKKVLGGTEIDIFIPSLNTGIEYNGLFWHCERMGKDKHYHLNKQRLCEEKGIKLIHIFSDEWLNKESIVKNRLKHILGVSDNRLYARKCTIKVIDTKMKNKYLNENHLQGGDRSSIKLGAFHNDMLVGVMTFSKLRKAIGHTDREGSFELVRFTSNNVVGLPSKMLKHFIRNYTPNKIITYADKRWSTNVGDNMYTKIGFEYLGDTKPNYWYTKRGNTRLHRFGFRKDILVKKGYDKKKTEKTIMSELGFDTVWDCGSGRYEFYCL